MKNQRKRGMIEYGVIMTQIVILSVAGGFGLVYNSNPVASGFFIATNALVGYSQLPHVKEDFRNDKYMEICDYNGNSKSDCENALNSLSNDQVLAEIRDDGTPFAKDYYLQGIRNAGNGGNFRNGNMNP